MANKHKRGKDDAPQHEGSSRRIQRRLSKEVQQEGLSAEAQRENSPADAAPKKQTKKRKQPSSGGKTPFAFFSRSKNHEKAPRTKRRFFLLKTTLVVLASLAVIATGALAIFLSASTQHDELWLDLDQIPYKTETLLYATDPATQQQVLYTTLPCLQNKVYIEGSQMPQNLKDAFVAVEDQNFYTHSGVSIKRTLYAMANEIKHLLTDSYLGGDSGRKQGASTINQQLIKNLTHDDDNSNMAGYLRKVREIYRAFRLDSAYDKDTILEAYLNTISFTNNTAGVQTEAQALFGKNVEQLTLAECASLAAITRNPARYNPLKNPEPHLQRRNYVLAEMQQQGYITSAEREQATAEVLNLADTEPTEREQVITSYFTDAVMDAVVTQLSSEYRLSRQQATNLLYNGGLRIHTTLAPALQSAMESTLESASLYPRPAITVTGPLTNDDNTPLLDKNGKQQMGDISVRPQAAMISLTYDGGVAGVVGGLGEKEISRGFNRGTSAVRQVGSTMKPIGPYAVAFEENRIHWSSAFLDAPVEKQEDEKTGEMLDWPKNVDSRYSNKDILVKEAMARSVNTIAVRVGEVAGTRTIYNFVKNDLAIPTILASDAKPGPMVLGSSTTGITPAEMAKAYTMFGNGGFTPEIHYYSRITNGTGDTLATGPHAETRSISADTSYVMNRLLREVMVGNGTASGMSVNDDMDSVGKTGTTSDYRDHWFIGLTPYYVTASWYGYDENAELRVNNRRLPPTLAWQTVMQQAQQSLPPLAFPTDPTVQEIPYCTASGYAAGPSCPANNGFYRSTAIPEENCPLHA